LAPAFGARPAASSTTSRAPRPPARSCRNQLSRWSEQTV
jgi:hypothetical protein